jgi:tetratricopeptide (TPR) repeat protein
MDSASLELENHILELARECTMLVILCYRPDREAPIWRLREELRSEHADRYTEVILRPLPAEQSEEMIDHLLTTAELPESLRAQILDRADGNPYFIEEIIRTLIERGQVVRDESGTFWRAAADGADIHIPDNLQTLLVARIDRLEEDVRRTLQLASVIGRSFYQRVLALIEEKSQALDERLGELQRVDIILQTAQLPEMEYMFRHTMAQEAAYSTLLRKRRREFHLKVAEALKKLFPNQLEELAPNLARHYFEAQNFEPALTHYIVAGDAAFRLYAHSEAVGHFDRALQIAEQADASTQQLIHAFTRKGRAQELDYDHGAALSTYEEMLALARHRADKELELAALVVQGTLRSTSSNVRDFGLGEKLGQEALALARALENKKTEAKVQWNLMNAYHFQGRDVEAVEAGERSLALAQELNLREQLAYTSNDLAYVYLARGPMTRGAEMAQIANGLFRESDNRPMLTDNLGLLGWIHGFGGRFDEALAVSNEGFDIAESIDNLWGKSNALNGLSYATWSLGELARAIEMMELCLSLGREANFDNTGMLVGAWLALAYAGLGALERGQQLAQQARETVERHNPFFLPYPMGALASIQVIRGDVVGAAETLRDVQVAADTIQPIMACSVETAYCRLKVAQGEHKLASDLTGDIIHYVREHGMAAVLPDFLYIRSLAQLGLGQRDQALESLTHARAEAKSIGLRRDLWQILALLAEVKGDEVSRVEAMEEIEWQAERTGTPELRKSFLDLPQIRAFLESDPR